MVGYVAGPRAGAITYNVAHNMVTGLGLVAIGWFAAIAPLALAGAVLVAIPALYAVVRPRDVLPAT
jgi:hypothetical protein